MVVSKRDDCVKGYSIVILTGDERSLVRAFRAFLRQVTGLIGLAETVSFTLRFRIFVASINLYKSDA